MGSARGGGRPGGGRRPGEHAAAAGGEPLPGCGARGSPAVPRRSPAFSPHPRYGISLCVCDAPVPPADHIYVTFSRVDIVPAPPALVRASRAASVARCAARAQGSAEPASVAPVCVSRTCCPSAARAAAAWTATDTAARSPAATRFRAAARPHAPSSTSAITKVRCPARGGRSAVSVGPPLSVQTSRRTLSPAGGNHR